MRILAHVLSTGSWLPAEQTTQKNECMFTMRSELNLKTKIPSLLLYSVNYKQVLNKSNTLKGRQIKLHLLKGEISKNL